MENSLKALILAASISITCLVISLGFYTVKEGRRISAVTTEKLSTLATHLEEDEYTQYDGLLIRGSDVVNFMQKHLGGYSFSEIAPIYVYVSTGVFEKAYINREDLDKVRNHTNEHYISPLGKFKGRVIRDRNDVIEGVSFIATN